MLIQKLANLCHVRMDSKNKDKEHKDNKNENKVNVKSIDDSYKGEREGKMKKN